MWRLYVHDEYPYWVKGRCALLGDAVSEPAKSLTNLSTDDGRLIPCSQIKAKVHVWRWKM